MGYIELKNDKDETSEDLQHLLQYILRLDKTAEEGNYARHRKGHQGDNRFHRSAQRLLHQSQ